MNEARSLAALVNPTPKQREFIEATKAHTYSLYGGAAGGGKSYILRWIAVMYLLTWAAEGRRNVRFGVFCEDYPSLQDRHLSKVRFEFPSWLGDVHEQSREFRLREEHGGGVVAFRNLDDPSKYQSVEFAGVAIDELTRDGKDVFLYLLSRLRWPGINAPKLVAATNPGGPGHFWVKKLWVDRDFSGEDARFDPDEFAFVQARVTDNPHLPPSYFRQLDMLPDAMRRAFLEGDWDLFEGQFFTEFRRDLHVVEPFEVPPDWKRWCALDYGTAAPYCCLWLAQEPSTGRRFVYREDYSAGLVAREQAQRILRLSGAEAIQYTAADPDMFRRKNDDGTAPADSYRQEGVTLRMAFNNRVQGWNNVRQALSLLPDGKPGLQIFSTCRNLIRTLPMMLHDPHDPEDLDTKLEDHALDALRYGLSLVAVGERRPPKRRPLYSLTQATRAL